MTLSSRECIHPALLSDDLDLQAFTLAWSDLDLSGSGTEEASRSESVRPNVYGVTVRPQTLVNLAV